MRSWIAASLALGMVVAACDRTQPESVASEAAEAALPEEPSIRYLANEGVSSPSPRGRL
jgi:hypothetical protein